MMPSGRSQAVSGAVRGAIENGIDETADSTYSESHERTGCDGDGISCTASFGSPPLLSGSAAIPVAEEGRGFGI
jgi:hypothetical protein